MLPPQQPCREQRRFIDHWRSECERWGESRQAAETSAVIEDVDVYLEKLYDDAIDQRTEGARWVLALAREPRNLESLVENETLLGAMARTLREEHMKHMELCTVLLQIFYCMSHFSQLHPLLMSHRLGDLCMRIVDL